MSRIKVSTDALDHIARQLNQVSGEMERSRKSLLKFQGQVVFNRFMRNNIVPQVADTTSKLQHVSSHTDAVSRSVRQAGKVFEVCEKKLLAAVHDVPAIARREGSLLKSSPFLKAMDKIYDRLGISKYDRHYQPVTVQREQARDAMMQLQMMQLLEEEGMTEADWRAANTEQRKAMLNRIFKRIMTVYGVDITPEISFFDKKPDSKGMIHLGSYNPKRRVVSFNTYTIKDDSYKESVSTLVHELRHAYQHAAVTNPENFIVNRQTLATWEHNMDNYKTPPKDGYQAYRDQPIERDARAAEEGVMGK